MTRPISNGENHSPNAAAAGFSHEPAFGTNPFRFRGWWLGVMLCASGAATQAFAADYTWTGTSNNTWSTAANWGGTAPVNAAATSVFFGNPASGRVSPSLTAPVTVGAITFNSGASAFTISRTGSNTLTLAGGGSVTNNSVNLQTISAPTVLGGATTWNAAGGNLSVGGVISGAGGSITKTGTETLTLAAANTYTGGTNISAGTLVLLNAGRLGSGGVVNNGVLNYNSTGSITEANAISGTGGLIQSGSGTTSLTATNSYQGGTTISAGALQFSSLGNFGSGAVGLNGGALRWAAGNTADVSAIVTLGGGAFDTNGNNVTLASALAGGGPLIKSGAGILTLNAAPAGVGSVSVTGGTLQAGAVGVLPAAVAYSLAGTGTNGTATLDLNGYDLSISSLALAGSANAVSTVTTGDGVLTLGGNVSYPGTGNPGTASINGNLNLGAGTRTFDIADSTNTATEVTINAAISGAGGGITKIGTGALALTGTNSYSGPTTVSNGVLQFSSSENFGNGAVTVNGFSSVLRWAPGNTDGVAGGITIAGGYGRLDTNGNEVALAAAITGSGRLTKEGAGALTVAAAPNINALFVHGGTLRLGADNALPSVNGVTVAGTANDSGVATTLDLNGHDLSVGSLDLGVYYSGRNAVNTVGTGASTLTLRGNLTYAIQGTPYEYYDPGTALISGKLALTAGSHAFNIADSFNTTLEMNISADIGGAGGINKTGEGNLVLSGTNSYSGDTIISAGVLRADLPATSNLQLNGGVIELGGDRTFVYGTDAGQVQWTGGGGGFSAFGGNRVVDVKDQAGTSLDFVWGGGGFVANDSSLILSSAISDSTISLDNDIDFNGATRTVTVNNGTAAIDAALNGVLSNGGLAVTGAGLLKLTGANSYAGGTTVDGGLEFSTGSLGSGPVRINNNGLLRWAAGNTDSLAGMPLSVGTNVTLDTNGNNVVLDTALGGNGNVIKAGQGTLTLNAASPGATGYVSVLDGTLRFGVADALSATSYGTLTVNGQTPGGGATFDTNGRNFGVYVLTFGGTTAQADVVNMVSTGAGTLNYTVGADIKYQKAASAVNDPGPAFLSGNLAVLGFAGTFAVDDSSKATEELTVSANISNNGNFGIAKTGAGTLVLSGNNSYGGNTTLSAGTLVIGSDTALSTGTLVLANGTTLRGDGSARSLANNVTFTGTSSVIGGTSDLSFGRLTNAQSGNPTLTISNTGTTSFASMNLAASGTTNRTVTLAVAADAEAVITGIIANGGTSSAGSLVKSGAGTLTLAGDASTYGGKTTIAAGTLVAGKLDDFGSSRSSSLGAPTNAANGTIDIGSGANGATLKYTGAAASTNRVVNLAGTTGAATLDASGSGAITFSSSFTASGGGTKTLFLTGGNTGANTIGGAIVNSSTGTTSLEKSGGGTWVLSGASTYSGSTTINGGRLVVDGSLALNSSVAINNGAFLSGHGSVGAVTIAGGGTIAPGNSPGTLSSAGQTWNGGGIYLWEINSATGVAGTGWDLLEIGGTLTINSTVPVPFVIDVTSLTLANVPGDAIGFAPDADYSWTIASAATIDGFDPAKFVIETGNFANAPGSSAFTLTRVGNDIVLNYTAPVPEPSMFVLGATALLGGLVRRRR